MESSELKNIRESLRPIFLSSWIFGVPRVTHKSVYRFTYSLVISLIYIGAFSATFKARLRVVSAFNYAMEFFYLISQVMMFVGGVGTILFWVARGAGAMENTIVKLAALDVEFKELGVKIRHREVKIRQIVLLCIFITIWITVAGIHEYLFHLSVDHNDSSLLMTFCFAYSSNVPHILILLGEFVFSTMMFTFYIRFRSVNQALNTTSKNYQDDVFLGSVIELPRTRGEVDSAEELLIKIRRFYKTHHRLCEIAKNLSSAFSLLLYCTISVNFSLLLYRGIVLYTLIFVQLDELDVRLVLSVIWIIYYALKLWLITLNCCHVSDEANRFGLVLHGIPICDKEFYAILYEYSLHLYENKLEFTAGGLYSIDISLVTALVSYFNNYILYAVDMWNGIQSSAAKTTTEAN